MSEREKIDDILERLEVRTYQATRDNPGLKLGQIPGLLGERDKDLAAIQQLLTEAREVTGETSDGYHTFNELYEFRKLYNAALFNEWATQKKYNVRKSWNHSDGQPCFGGGWFVVTAELPTGQISNHYEAKDWGLFRVNSARNAPEWDGHTPQDVAKRLTEYLTPPEALPSVGGSDE